MNEIRILAIDFSVEDTDIYGAIEQEMATLHKIAILINNVGICYPGEKPEYFLEIEGLDEFITRIINVNVLCMTRMIAMVLPRMVRERRGLVLNMSSTSGITPTPFLSLYSATKSFIIHLSQALNLEYKRQGVLIQCLCPHYVSTKMSHNKKVSFWCPTAKTYVENAIKHIGYGLDCGYFGHSLYMLPVLFLKSISTFSPVNFNSMLNYLYLYSTKRQIDKKIISLV